MNTLPRPKPLLVVILDGWGISLSLEGNAVAAAETPVMDNLAAIYPMAVIAASGLEVGLPVGQGGNSETGHRNIGAGRVEYQILASINRAIEDKSFFENEVLTEAFAQAKKNNSDLHLVGLVSRGGVHSHLDHLTALLQMAVKQGFRERVYIHMITDGRDTPPQSAIGYLEALETTIGKYGVGKMASVTGRWYAMDRNKNWERTESFFNMLTGGARPLGASSARQAVSRAYEAGLDDEMIEPTAITRGGAPIATIKDKDAVILFNFRPDRCRQIAQLLAKIDQLHFVTLSQYDPDIEAEAAFREEIAPWPMSRVIAEAGMKQLHIAETEKYAHVTYYLNVGRERPFAEEKRVLIKSSAVRNFADDPKMEAGAITDRLVTEIKKDIFDVYIINYANADMVGHTGNLAAAVKACSFLDKCLGRLTEAVLEKNGAMIVTADHGNVEGMIEPKQHGRKTDHTSNPVPFYYIRQELGRTTPKSGKEIRQIMSSTTGVLADVAPTVLDILRLEKPTSMTGVSLLGSLR